MIKFFARYKMILLLLAAVILFSCIGENDGGERYTGQDYRERMRQWVMTVSAAAKEENPDFIIIPQNCSPLFTQTGYADGKICIDFLKAIDGAGQEGISYGNNRYNIARDKESREDITALLNVGIENGISVVSVNYCDTPKKVDDAIYYDEQNGYISYVSPSLDLTDIPLDFMVNENADDIKKLSDAKNVLFMLNPEKYNSVCEYIDALKNTNYDVLIIDAFFYDNVLLKEADVESLKTKNNGGSRLVVSYLSIGEAEDYRYYWKEEWYDNLPQWMLRENPNWAGNYPVEYWNEEWQSIIATGESSYLSMIMDAGFDGVYLDIVDGYQTFEDLLEE